MVIHKHVIAIKNLYDIIQIPKKIWHSSRGKILTVEQQSKNIVVYYENEPGADQEFYSLILAVETGKETQFLGGKEPKYLRTLMLDDGLYVLHFYTNQ